MSSKAILAAALALPAVCVAGALPGVSQRERLIVGGQAATLGEFPSIVAVSVNGRMNCGGTLLNADTVLTAAHCTFRDVAELSVRAGSLTHSGGKQSAVVSAVNHPDWTGNTAAGADISIYKLATPIEESDVIKYAALPPAGFDPAAGSIGTVAGWYVAPDRLRWAVNRRLGASRKLTHRTGDRLEVGSHGRTSC
jgi:trypsin